MPFFIISLSKNIDLNCFNIQKLNENNNSKLKTIFSKCNVRDCFGKLHQTIIGAVSFVLNVLKCRTDIIFESKLNYLLLVENRTVNR